MGDQATGRGIRRRVVARFERSRLGRVALRVGGFTARRFRSVRWSSWAFVAPALLLIAFFLVYPTIMTIFRSFYGRSTNLFGAPFVGLDNWRFVFTNEVMLTALRPGML